MDPEIDDVPEGYDIVEVVDSDEELDDEDLGEEQETADEDRPKRESRESSASGGLSAAEKRAIEAERKVARYEQQAKSQETEKMWQDRFKEIDRQFNGAKKNILSMSNNADDPNDFIDKELDRLIAWRDMEVGKYFGSREKAKDDQIKFLSVPHYAEDLAKEFKLKRSDIDDLKRFAPEDMRVRAMTIAEFRDQERTVAENNKRAAKKSGSRISPGGRGGGNVRRVKAGSDDHLLALLGELPPR